MRSCTMEIIGFTFIWQCFCTMALTLKICSAIYRQRLCHWLVGMETSNIGKAKCPLLQKVLSPSLDPKKSWFALNSVLCSAKPSTLCSSGFDQVFSDEYRQVELDDLISDDGVPASASWFSVAGRQSEKVYVASAFGLILSILRQN